MDISKAIRHIRKAIDEEIPHLKQLHDNQEYYLWYKKMCKILEVSFGKASDEYIEFSRAAKSADMLHHLSLPKDMKQSLYLEYFAKFENVLKSVLQNYEILGFEKRPPKTMELPPKAFISHGKESVALSKLEEFLRALGVDPLIVKEQPSLDKTVDDKVNFYLDQADFVVILATGDDKIEGKLHPRQNVVHEIGLAQKTHTGKIIYLLEAGAEFPSNISPKVWERFKQRNMMKTFLCIAKELRAYGMLKAVKP